MKTQLSKSASLLLLAAFSGVVGVFNSPASAQSFDLIVGAPATPFTSIRGLSADGLHAAGQNSGAVGFAQAFIWSRPEGVRRLSDLGVPSLYSGLGISGNGQVVVGAGVGGGYRWSQAGGLQTLPPPVGYVGASTSSANNDGSFVGGQVQINRPQGLPPAYFATTWDSEGTPTILDPNRNLGDSFINAISRDGSTVVGYGRGGGLQAFKWTQAGGIQVLPNLLGTSDNYNEACAVSGNGQFIVGISNDRS
ncbi:MAG: hypothetical protein WC718_08075, partial [Phycisphaerales bacterium]